MLTKILFQVQVKKFTQAGEQEHYKPDPGEPHTESEVSCQLYQGLSGQSKKRNCHHFLIDKPLRNWTTLQCFKFAVPSNMRLSETHQQYLWIFLVMLGLLSPHSGAQNLFFLTKFPTCWLLYCPYDVPLMSTQSLSIFLNNFTSTERQIFKL